MDVNMYAVYAIFHPYVHTIFACNANVLVGVVGVAKNTKTGTDPYSWPYLTPVAESWPEPTLDEVGSKGWQLTTDSTSYQSAVDEKYHSRC